MDGPDRRLRCARRVDRRRLGPPAHRRARRTPLNRTATREQTATRRGWQGGYLVLALATLTAGLTGPGQTIGVSVFTDHFVDDLDLSREQVSFAYLIGTLLGALLLPFVGRFIDRRGVRLAQIIIGTGFALALANMSLVQGFVWLAVGFTGIRFLGQGSLSLISMVTVSLRYFRNRGLALGIYSTASAGLMALVPLILALTISQFGWRATWVIAAVVVGASVVPIAVFGLRQLPKTSGDAHLAADLDEDDHAHDVVSVDRRTALGTRSFWILAAATSAAGMLATALNFHQIDLLGDVGISSAGAAALFVPQVIGSTLAGLTVGWVSDRMSVRLLPAICMALLVLTHVLAAVASPGWIVITYAITLGAMGGGIRTATATLLPAWFGTAHLGSIQGLLTFTGVAASALGPVALAVVEGWFGSYPPAVMVLATIPVAAMLFGLTAPRVAVAVPSSSEAPA